MKATRFPMPVLGFLLRGVVTFAAFLAVWPAVEAPCARLFAALGNAVAGYGSNGTVRFAPASDGESDIELTVLDPGTRTQRLTSLSSRRHVYLPLAFLVSTVFAAPVRLGRRGFALLLAIPIFGGYAAGKMLLFPAAYGPVEGAFCAEAAQRVLWVLSASSAGWMLPPLLIAGPAILFAARRAR